MCKRCAELLAENARLKDMLEVRSRADLIGRLRTYLGVTDQQARILLRLYRERGGMVSHADIHAVMVPRYYSKQHHADRCTDYLRVQVAKARRHTGPGMIETIRAYGLRLTPAGVNLITEALRGERWSEAA